MAQVQNHLLQFRGKPVESISDIPNYLNEIRKNEKRREDYEAKLRNIKKGKKNDGEIMPEMEPMVEISEISKEKEEKIQNLSLSINNTNVVRKRNIIALNKNS